MGPCKIMTDTLAPVERTNWALPAWDSTLAQNDALRPCCMVRTICGKLVTSCLHLRRFFLLSPHPLPTLPSPPLLPPAHPLVNWAKIDAHLRKNRLQRPEIKQGTTSKVNCILFNRLLNPVLLNKSVLVRVKVSNFNLKSLRESF